MPKGHVEAGESPEQATVRERREETGLDPEIEETLGDVTYTHLRRDPGRPGRRVRVRIVSLRHRGGRVADRDAEMADVRRVPIGGAEATIPDAKERRLVRTIALLASPEPA